MRSFGSDNHSGIHPQVLEAITKINCDHQKAYGTDDITAIARDKFRELFGDVEVFMVFNGTGANVTAISAACRPYHSVICAKSAHINVDECGAPVKFSGSTLVAIPTPDGKLTVDLVLPELIGFGDCHRSQPRVISISQTTEMGTLYSLEEIKALADLAHTYNMVLHVDGARFANGIAALGCTIEEFVATGVDMLSFGGTKNGLMIGEAVVFFDKSLCSDFEFIRKQSMQLYSKMRFIAAQFIAYLENDLWLKNAQHANQMAQLLYKKLLDIPAVELTQTPAANALFLILPEDKREMIREKYFFYDWDESRGEIRLMCSFDTTPEDIENLTHYIEECCMAR